MKYIIYTDGGSRGNPGSAGVGVVITDEQGNVLKRGHKAIGRQTNNYAEYVAVIFAFENLKRLIKKADREHTGIEFRMDSEFLYKQLTNQYQIKEESLFPLFIKIHNTLVADFPRVSFKHIPREKNRQADKLSNLAMDEAERKPGPKLF